MSDRKIYALADDALAGRFVDIVIPQMLAWRGHGLRAALVTLVGIEGRAPRPLGSQMAVCETGEYVGLISGGCVEASIVHEACAALEQGEVRRVRYGAGSPYLDVKLPCGSGIELFIDPLIQDAVLQTIEDSINRRQLVALSIDRASGLSTAFELRDNGASQSSSKAFVRSYLPVTRPVIFGNGAILEAFAMVAKSLEWDCVAASNERATLGMLSHLGGKTHHLTRPEDGFVIEGDPWTAWITVFHDHSWEPALLRHALNQPGFYIGALGSRMTHQARCVSLKEMGIAVEDVARIKAPIGLAIGAQTPSEIAISIAAEMISARRGSLA